MMTNDNQKDYLRESSKTNIDNSSNSCKGFMIGAVIGGIVGAATALFLAPKSGKELRGELNEKAKHLSEKTDQIKHTAVEKKDLIKHNVAEKTEKIREVAKEKGTEFAEAAKAKTSSLTNTVSKQTSTIIENVKNIKKRDNDDNNEVEPANTVESTKEAVEGKTSSDQAQSILEETEKALQEAETRIKE
ncbi:MULTISPECIES: YtxH domain-containing protein [Bacillus]|uniref:YtxH domain-containing protein n=1 Tax=Bacillus TaxID=1386 RepID=UPI0003051FDC|nr:MULTISPECIES: YtxH domain-containing protein [Bacillus]